jgi:hypothetical protein
VKTSNLTERKCIEDENMKRIARKQKKRGRYKAEQRKGGYGYEGHRRMEESVS